MLMDKKGLIWDELGKAILALVIILILFLIIYLLRDRLSVLTEKLRFLFGG